ncbi:MAG: tRNA (cytidine(34)-2'-O)-methyltransferase [Alphaproteobacteria bacterium]
MRLALFQPDIAQNAGTLMRLSACMGIGIDIIEPCGFLWNDNKLKRAGMDYIDKVDYTRHINWDNFINFTKENNHRIILLTTKADTNYTDFEFQENDILLLGQESSGAPDFVHETAGGRVIIPMYSDFRSINIATAGAMVLGEALRQTGKI